MAMAAMVAMVGHDSRGTEDQALTTGMVIPEEKHAGMSVETPTEPRIIHVPFVLHGIFDWLHLKLK